VANPPAKDALAKTGPNLRAIAHRDGTLAICLTLDNKVKLLDGETGAVKAELAVAEPRAVPIRAATVTERPVRGGNRSLTVAARMW
jgi:hypothetical protein